MLPHCPLLRRKALFQNKKACLSLGCCCLSLTGPHEVFKLVVGQQALAVDT